MKLIHTSIVALSLAMAVGSAFAAPVRSPSTWPSPVP